MSVYHRVHRELTEVMERKEGKALWYVSWLLLDVTVDYFNAKLLLC